MKEAIKKIWYLKFPTYLYNEDVKALAKKSDLIIMDEKFKGDPTTKEIATDVPMLTFKCKKVVETVTIEEPKEKALEITEEPKEEPKKRGRPKKA